MLCLCILCLLLYMMNLAVSMNFPYTYKCTHQTSWIQFTFIFIHWLLVLSEPETIFLLVFFRASHVLISSICTYIQYNTRNITTISINDNFLSLWFWILNLSSLNSVEYWWHVMYFSSLQFFFHCTFFLFLGKQCNGNPAVESNMEITKFQSSVTFSYFISTGLLVESNS